MTRLHRILMLTAALLTVSTLSSGCAYMMNRGNDAADMIDVGITVTGEPTLGIYIGFLSVLDLGYAEVDGKMIGLGQRRAGVMDMRYHAGGLVIGGYEQVGYDGRYNSEDPDSPPRRGVGVGMAFYPPPQSATQALQLPKFLHLGWIGLSWNFKLVEIIDFILGLTALDICDDDRYYEE